jgi:hypothetical protein
VGDHVSRIGCWLFNSFFLLIPVEERTRLPLVERRGGDVSTALTSHSLLLCNGVARCAHGAINCCAAMVLDDAFQEVERRIDVHEP